MKFDREAHIKSLENLIACLEAEGEASIVEKAWAMTFLRFIQAGHRVTDLPWFKYTKSYTGKEKVDKTYDELRQSIEKND